MPYFLFFGRLANGRAACMNVHRFPFFNTGEYTPNQISKLQHVAVDLLDNNELYKTCVEIIVKEPGKVHDIRQARVTRNGKSQ